MSKTILVTRAKGDEQEITEALHELGHHVIHEPLTEIILNHTIRAELHLLLTDEPNAVLITSKHGVQALSLLTEIRDIPLLCVGTASAEAAASLGFTRVAEAGGTVDHVIETIRDGYDEDARFLYISGEHITSDLPAIIASFGMSCDRLTAYGAVAAEYLSDTLIEQLKRGAIDAVTFFSPRNIDIFLDLLERAECGPATIALDAFVLSEEIASHAGDGWKQIYIAAKPTLASLVECVDNSYAQ